MCVVRPASTLPMFPHVALSVPRRSIDIWDGEVRDGALCSRKLTAADRTTGAPNAVLFDCVVASARSQTADGRRLVERNEGGFQTLDRTGTRKVVALPIGNTDLL